MKRFSVPLGAALVAVALVVSASAQAATRLTAVVGPGFNITLKKGRTKVKTLKPGRYVIVVRDRTNIHNFHLKGPGVNKATGVAFTGTKTLRVRLRRGTYSFVCDPHDPSMNGEFKVR